jgi:hypothetical protein
MGMSKRLRSEHAGTLPPLPDGAIGWDVYTAPAVPLGVEPDWSFAEFVAHEAALGPVAARFADEVAAYDPPGGDNGDPA